MANRHATLRRLRRQLQELPEPEPTELCLVSPVAGVAAPSAQRPITPPGGWPVDAGWREEAEFHQSQMGEEPQC